MWRIYPLAATAIDRVVTSYHVLSYQEAFSTMMPAIKSVYESLGVCTTIHTISSSKNPYQTLPPMEWFDPSMLQSTPEMIAERVRKASMAATVWSCSLDPSVIIVLQTPREPSQPFYRIRYLRRMGDDSGPPNVCAPQEITSILANRASSRTANSTTIPSSSSKAKEEPTSKSPRPSTV